MPFYSGFLQKPILPERTKLFRFVLTSFIQFLIFFNKFLPSFSWNSSLILSLKARFPEHILTSPKINVNAALYPKRLLMMAFKKAIANFSIYIIENVLFSVHTDLLIRHIVQQVECKTQRYVPIDY